MTYVLKDYQINKKEIRIILAHVQKKTKVALMSNNFYVVFKIVIYIINQVRQQWRVDGTPGSSYDKLNFVVDRSDIY